VKTLGGVVTLARLTVLVTAGCARPNDVVGIIDPLNTETLTMLVRDFRVYDPADPSTNPDFENVPDINQQGLPDPNKYGPWDDRGIVDEQLGSDGLPVYRAVAGHSLTTHGQSAFDQWFRDVPGTNVRAVVPLPFVRDDFGLWSYDSLISGVPFQPGDKNMFFPIDDSSAYATVFGNQGNIHNYSFTVVLRASFTYAKGQVLHLRGDDDVFVFIAGKQVIDLGGIHDTEVADVLLDTLGLTGGEQTTLALFFAERHLWRSSLYLQTNFRLSPELP
jgi:fibro-slime domain-containing protein